MADPEPLPTKPTSNNTTHSASTRAESPLDHANPNSITPRPSSSETELLGRLQAVMEVALSHLSLEELQHSLLHRIRTLLSGDIAILLLLTDDGQHLSMCASSGIKSGRQEQTSRQIRIPVGRGIAGRIATARQPLIFQDLKNEEVLNPVLLEQGVRSLVGAPLLIKDRMLGVLYIGTSYLHEFTSDDAQLLQLACDRFAIAIERAQLYEAVSEAEARKSAILEAALDCIILMNHEGIITEFNPAAEQTFGYERTQAIGQPLAELIIPPSLREAHNRGLKHYLETGDGPVIRQRIEITGMRRDGTEFPVELTVVPLHVNGRTFFTGYLRDITEVKRAKDRQTFLAEATNVLASSLDYQVTLSSVASMSVPALADWCAVDMLEENGTLARLAVAHMNPDKVQWAHELQERYPPDLEALSGVPNVLRTGKSELYSDIPDELLVASAKDAEHLHLIRDLGLTSAMIVPLVVQGRTMGALSFISAESGRHYGADDLSLAEELADRAALAVSNARLYHDSQESSRLKDEFLATMSHELRTPLNAILGWANLLSRGGMDEQSTLQALQTIERNARAQVGLIEDLIDVSRIITGKLRLDVRPVALAEVIEAAVDAVRPAAEAKSIRLQVLLDPQAGPVSGDSDRLQQVLWNLLSNALKFTPKGGRVQVRLERINSHVEITVSDNGQGISAEFLPHVFDRFRQADSTNTRKVGGLGLGLAIVHQLVELHGGTVQVASHGEGQGATFTVSLPLTAVHKADDARRRDQSHVDEERVHPRAGGSVALDCPPALVGLKVLVVDDETDSRELISAVLGQCEAMVTVVSSAGEALEAIACEPPDVLISDIGMPGEDGYSLIKKVRALPPQNGGRIPAVALTAYARAEDRIKALAAGFQMHTPKPVEPAELAAVVASLAQWRENGSKVE